MTENAIVIPGDPKASFTCITDDSRPDPSHAWARAHDHIFRSKDLNYFLQLEAAITCRHVVEAILKMWRAPRGVPVSWGWGKGWPGQ